MSVPNFEDRDREPANAADDAVPHLEVIATQADRIADLEDNLNEACSKLVSDYHEFSWPDMPIQLRKRFGIGPLYINAIRCKECGWYVRSRNRHDFRTCKCGKSGVDGGSFYGRRIGDSCEDIIVPFTNLTEEEGGFGDITGHKFNLLDLCTSHIDPEAVEYLNSSIDNCTYYPFPGSVTDMECGWLLCFSGQMYGELEDGVCEFPSALRYILEYALGLGFEYIRFDEATDELEGLKSYDW